MRDVLAVVSKILFYVLALAVIVWTASLTYSLVSRLLPGDDLTPFFSLALFDGGSLVWCLAFLFMAQGLPQRAVALLTMGLDMLGVMGVTIAELLLGGQELASIPPMLGTYVVWGVWIVTIINLVAIYAYHIADPAEMQEIETQTRVDNLLAEGQRQAAQRFDHDAMQLGTVIADRLYQSVLAKANLPVIIDVPAGDVPDQILASANTANDRPNPTAPPKSSGQRRS